MTLLHIGGCAPDDCSFPRVKIGKADATDLIPAGTEVLLPCEKCGFTAYDYMTWLDDELDRHIKAFTRHLTNRDIPLYHWSPSNRRQQIVRHGLLANRRPTTHSEFKAPYICFATDPAWAWALSGGMAYSPIGEWDLWETWWDKLEEPWILPDEDTDGIYEVRTSHRVFKRDVKYLGSRTKE